MHPPNNFNAQTIHALQVHALRVPMPTPHRTASGVVAESPLIATDIRLGDGTVGHSLIFTYTVAALKPTAELINNLLPLLQDRPLAPADVYQYLQQRLRLLGSQGLVGMAISAIDMALWDALARQHGLPLCRLLGAEPKPIRAYAPVGYDGELESARIAEAWARQGFTGVKAKIGYPKLAEDIAVVRAMRQAVGPDVQIMVDYNQSLNPSEATHRLRALDEEGLAWVEEPTTAHDHAAHARIAAASCTPIQAGENWWSPMEVRHAIESQATDLLMLDVMKIGGVTGWLGGSALAQTHGLPLSSHLFPEVSAQLLCASPTAHWLEYADWWSEVLTEPVVVEKGWVSAATMQGSGIAWAPDALNEFAAC
ncbi:MAG: enolase C-terminal domain-like protein [Curvibacter sp.]